MPPVARWYLHHPINLLLLFSASASAAGSAMAIASDTALQLFGQPLPVVLASAAGALGVRSYLPSVGYFRALASATLWTAAGIALAPLAERYWAMPTGALAGLALAVAAAGQIAAPTLVAWFPGFIKGWLARLPNGQASTGGNNDKP